MARPFTLLAALAVAGLHGALVPNTIFNANVIYYGTGADAGGGACYLRDKPSWLTSEWLTGALSADLYNNSVSCGVCLKIYPLGNGTGANPLDTPPVSAGPTSPAHVFVNNLCSGCEPRQVAIAATGEGIFGAKFKVIPCPIIADYLVFDVKSTQPLRFQVKNNVIAISGVEVSVQGAWYELRRNAFNEWEQGTTKWPKSAQIFPLTLKVIGADGSVAFDYIEAPKKGTHVGVSQFDGSSNYCSTATETCASHTEGHDLCDRYEGLANCQNRHFEGRAACYTDFQEAQCQQFHKTMGCNESCPHPPSCSPDALNRCMEYRNKTKSGNDFYGGIIAEITCARDMIDDNGNSCFDGVLSSCRAVAALYCINDVKACCDDYTPHRITCDDTDLAFCFAKKGLLYYECAHQIRHANATCACSGAAIACAHEQGSQCVAEYAAQCNSDAARCPCLDGCGPTNTCLGR